MTKIAYSAIPSREQISSNNCRQARVKKPISGPMQC